jgi:hypothetical protein
MSKAYILSKLIEAADFNLLGSGTWPAHREFALAFHKTLMDLGLQEDVPGSPRTTRSTPLGLELKLDLMIAFAGAFDIWEVPVILQASGYLDDEEVDAVWQVSSEDEGRHLVYRYVLRAYLEFCNRSRFLN